MRASEKDESNWKILLRLWTRGTRDIIIHLRRKTFTLLGNVKETIARTTPGVKNDNTFPNRTGEKCETTHGVYFFFKYSTQWNKSNGFSLRNFSFFFWGGRGEGGGKTGAVNREKGEQRKYRVLIHYRKRTRSSHMRFLFFGFERDRYEMAGEENALWKAEVRKWWEGKGGLTEELTYTRTRRKGKRMGNIESQTR